MNELEEKMNFGEGEAKSMEYVFSVIKVWKIRAARSGGSLLHVLMEEHCVKLMYIPLRIWEADLTQRFRADFAKMCCYCIRSVPDQSTVFERLLKEATMHAQSSTVEWSSVLYLQAWAAKLYYSCAPIDLVRVLMFFLKAGRPFVQWIM